MARSPGLRNGGHYVFLGLGAGLNGLADGREWLAVAELTRIGLVLLEAASELVGAVEDFLQAQWHRHHLGYVNRGRYFRRAVMAWTIIGPVAVSTRPISSN